MTLLEYAESPDRFAFLADDVERFDDGRYCVLQGPTFASVSAVRVAPEELPALLAEVRERVAPHKRTVWQLGPSVEPADAADRLRALGLSEPLDRSPLLKAVALCEPPTGDVTAEIRRPDTLADYVAGAELSWETFGIPPEQRETPEQLAEGFEAQRRAGNVAWFLALADGRPAGVGRSILSDSGSFLIGGAVAPWARGRGLYRALVRARWEHAVERGLPTCITHAKPTTSYPILRRLGFEDVCSLDRLEDVR